MSSGQTFLVAVIGIPPHEQGVLKRIFLLSSYRARSYALVSITADPGPNILLVDGDEQEAVNAWRTLCARDKSKALLPTVMVRKEGSLPEARLYPLQRPLLAPAVLRMLDQIVIEAPTAAPAVTMPQYKALVVDDSLPIRKQVELELKQLGITSDIAESGEQAVEFLHSSPPYDIIFLDVVLPGVDGYNLCKTIKKDKQRKRTPVIMLTGKGSPFDRVRGKLAGCDTYLTKPMDREAFQGVIKKYLSWPLCGEVGISQTRQ